MSRRGLGSAPTRGRRSAIAVLVGLLACAALGPPAAAQTTTGPAVAVAPTCLVQGPSARILIFGAGWENGEVVLTRLIGNTRTGVGTATAKTSPSGTTGSFSFTATVVADAAFQIEAVQFQEIRRVTSIVAVVPTCRPQLSLKPPCLSASGTVQVSGSGFPPGPVSIVVDPFGNAELTAPPAAADGSGNFSANVTVQFTGAAVPIVASQVGTGAVIAQLPPTRALAFVDPCPPPGTTTSTTRPPPGATTTTAPPGATTTTGAPPPTVPPPGVPPVSIPTPGATAQVSHSPRTVRPGRCVVVVVSAAPPGLPVVARFADGPAVNGQTGPDGGSVVSVCHSHDSGVPLGPVQLLIGIGPAAPAPVFTILRVPPRPQPPMLQSGADGRRS